MAKAKKPAGAKGVMDVAHPDTAAPSGNSKSVIVSNRPLLKDPMVVAGDAVPDEAGPDKSLPAAQPARKLQPPDTVPQAIGSDAVAEPKAAEPKAADTDETPDRPETDEPDAGEGNDTDAKPEPATDKAPAKGDKKAPKPDAEAEAQAKRQAAVDKLADSKKYYLPIDTIEKKRSRRFVVLGIILSLLLIVAWADIALDAGLIQLGSIKPVTHFFSN